MTVFYYSARFNRDDEIVVKRHRTLVAAMKKAKDYGAIAGGYYPEGRIVFELANGKFTTEPNKDYPVVNGLMKYLKDNQLLESKQ